MPRGRAVVLASLAFGLATHLSTRAGDNEVKAELVQEGYRPSVVHGRLLYCRREEVSGTRFRKNVCLNESEIEERKRQTQESVEHLQERAYR